MMSLSNISLVLLLCFSLKWTAYCQQYFVCNNKYVEWNSLCDGFPDCLNGDDEREEICGGKDCGFLCDFGTSIEWDSVCNGRKDCLDGSDEAAEICKEIGCHNRKFFANERSHSSSYQCDNGQCISKFQVCDGLIDCDDNSDENPIFCSNGVCDITCPDDICNTTAWICDGVEECSNGADEASEVCKQLGCKQGYQCPGGQCRSWIGYCDGYEHCSDGSDEDPEYCLKRGCRNTYYFQCDNGQCLPRWDVSLCDGNNDCDDGSDEKLDYCGGSECKFNCTGGTCTNITFLCDGTEHCDNMADEAPELCKEIGCTTTEFQCENGQCLEESYHVCNGYQHCTDGSDENLALCLERGCQDTSRFQCDNGQCISKYRSLCDGHDDCDDGSDEKLGYCGETGCLNRRFQCQNGECLTNDYGKLCDGNEDCSDGSDEDPEICGNTGCNITCSDNSTCSSMPWLCDGQVHCHDGSDEGFEICNKIGCKDGRVYCNGECTDHIHDYEYEVLEYVEEVEEWLCDGEQHCITGNDESAALCSTKGCQTKVTCANGQCLKSELLLCDGAKCCEDGSDEDPAMCLMKGCRNKAQCVNGQCLRSELYFCDGVVHCDDGSDEVEAHCLDRDCLYFQCDSGQCLKGLHLVCDGVEDCLDGSDEKPPACGNETDSVPRCASTRIYISDSPCGISKGECIRTECTSCDSGIREGQNYRHCGDLEPQYKCCMDHVATSACCSIFGDPHISTYDGTTYAVQELGWFTVSEDKDGSWKVDGLFSCPYDNAWWTMINGVRVTVGGNVIEVDDNMNIKVNNVINNRQIIITDGTAIVKRPTLVSISLEAGVTVTLTGFSGRYTFKMCIQDRWFNRVEGLCGSWDGDDTNDDSAEVRTKQCNTFLHKRDADVEERQAPNCPKDGTPESRQWCTNQTDTMAENCPSVDTSSFFDSCAFDYCLGGEAAAFLTLGAYRAECFPPKQASCSSSGFRYYNTFENEKFQFLGTECEYDLAKDCSGNATWSVRITQAQEELHEAEGLLITSVTINFNGVIIEFHRIGRRVLVDGEEVLEDNYESPHDFILTHSGNMIILMSLDLQVKYNFRQLIHVNLEETWYDKTCGLCGPWNDIDDLKMPSGHDHQIGDGCEPARKTSSCNDSAEQEEAEKICMTALQSVHCTSTHPATRVERCATEYCMGGDAYLCEHVLEYMDECYDVERNEGILQHTPKSCTPRTEKTPTKGKHDSMVQTVKIIKKKKPTY